MLADVVCVIWIVMAGALGWKRRFRRELPSLVILLVTWFVSQFLAHGLMRAVSSALGFGPIDAMLFLSLGLWTLLYFVFWRLWLKFQSRPNTQQMRIELDEMGNPIVRGGALQGPLGGVIGLVRGVVLYIGVVSALAALVPSRFYKDGRGMAMVHPKSWSMKQIRSHDPNLKTFHDAARGLRSLQYLQRSGAARSKAFRHKELKAAWKTPAIRKLRKDGKLLNRANRKRQGRRDATLLLWLRSFQDAVAQPKTAKALALFAKHAPAPFDRGAKDPPKKRKKRRRKRR